VTTAAGAHQPTARPLLRRLDVHELPQRLLAMARRESRDKSFAISPNGAIVVAFTLM
jgi:hypothetical protein